jgi:hypothetical protein
MGLNGSIEGSNPSFSATDLVSKSLVEATHAPVRFAALAVFSATRGLF